MWLSTAIVSASGQRQATRLSHRWHPLGGKTKIGIPTITLDGKQDPLKPSGTANHAPMFINRHEHRVVDCGHNLPWEASHDFADAILTVRG